MNGNGILFTITKEHLDTGLRGFPVGTCPNSNVDPVQGLSYGGYPIQALADKQPEEVIYLLINRELPDAAQLATFKEKLADNSHLDKGVIEHLSTLPKQGHPMKWFLAAINVMGMYEGTGDYTKDCINVIAQLPEAVAAIFRIRSGWGDRIPSRPELGYMENFVHMLSAPGAKPDLVRFLRVFNILHFDHGGGNLSTFVGKAIASGHEDMYGSLVGAMAALAGPLHGMANQESLRFLKEVAKYIQDPTDEKAVQLYLEEFLAEGGVLYGFGHAVLRVEDPRATVQYALGEILVPKDPLFRLAQTIRKVGSEILKKKGKAANPYPNVDSVSGCLLSAMGLADENYYTVLFGMARCVGIAAQIVYERKDARGGKGTPIVRPNYLYTGPVRS
ncbi:MAG TPA: citrate (Si)-synthase [Fibrobacteria bacterium]|nr:citrate (Si)-synthase [Fibrobacteria bacterium]